MKTLVRSMVVSIVIMYFLQFTCLAQDTQEKPAYDLSYHRPAPPTYEQAMLSRLDMDMQSTPGQVPPPKGINIKDRHVGRNIAVILAGGGMIGAGVWCATSRSPEYSFRDVTTSNTLKTAGESLFFAFGSAAVVVGTWGLIKGF